MIFLFKGVIFQFHVSFRGSTYLVGKIKFKLFFSGSRTAEWVFVSQQLGVAPNLPFCRKIPGIWLESITIKRCLGLWIRIRNLICWRVLEKNYGGPEFFQMVHLKISPWLIFWVPRSISGVEKKTNLGNIDVIFSKDGYVFAFFWMVKVMWPLAIFYMCQCLNSLCFPVLGDGHQSNSRGYIYIDSLWKVGWPFPLYSDIWPWHIWVFVVTNN